MFSQCGHSKLKTALKAEILNMAGVAGVEPASAVLETDNACK